MAYGGTTKSAPVKYRVPLLTHQKLKNQTLSPSFLPSRTDIIQERQKRRQLTVIHCFTVERNLSLCLCLSLKLIYESRMYMYIVLFLTVWHIYFILSMHACGN